MCVQPAGIIIALEGIDGAGKSTQAWNLSDFLRKRNVAHRLFAFPDYDGPLGALIKHYLKIASTNPHILQMLFAAERIRHLDTIYTSLQLSQILIIDRYKASSYVYGVAMGLETEWCANLESPLPDADLTLLLDIDPNLSVARTGRTDPIERDRDLLHRCRQLYLAIGQRTPTWQCIDASGSEQDTFEQIRIIIENLVLTKGTLFGTSHDETS